MHAQTACTRPNIFWPGYEAMSTCASSYITYCLIQVQPIFWCGLHHAWQLIYQYYKLLVSLSNTSIMMSYIYLASDPHFGLLVRPQVGTLEFPGISKSPEMLVEPRCSKYTVSLCYIVTYVLGMYWACKVNEEVCNFVYSRVNSKIQAWGGWYCKIW